MKKTAILLGATGLTGNILLHKLLEDTRYDTIKLFSRTKIKGLPNKVTQFVGDLLNLEQFKEDFKGDGIPVAAAKLSKENNITTFLVISAMGANKESSVFYNRTKGEMEHDVLEQNIIHTYILRPSLIGGERKERRIVEKVSLVVFKIIQPLFIGNFKQYKIINPESIAQAMLNLANRTSNAEVIITSDDIKKLAKKQ